MSHGWMYIGVYPKPLLACRAVTPAQLFPRNHLYTQHLSLNYVTRFAADEKLWRSRSRGSRTLRGVLFHLHGLEICWAAFTGIT